LFKADTNAYTPAFAIGDFNGDGRPDLVVPVRPNRALNKKNKSKPPFIYQEVLDVGSSEQHALVLNMGDLAAVEVWPLLAIIHNIKRASLNCSVRTDKYVLLFPPDQDATAIKIFQGRRLPPGTIGDPKEDSPPPQLKGDAILTVNARGDGTAVYWDGRRYRWYPFDG
jgi:hypothetical protein